MCVCAVRRRQEFCCFCPLTVLPLGGAEWGLGEDPCLNVTFQYPFEFTGDGQSGLSWL